MVDEIQISPDQTKAERYASLISQIDALLDDSGKTANLGNLMAALKAGMSFWWIGLYEVSGDSLVLGIFQGPVACTRIEKGRGVCGTSWLKEDTIIVDDVDSFPGHIACSSASKSEIVIPGRNASGEVAFVLDVDSERQAAFDGVDQEYLEQIVKRIERYY